ncbi:MAG: type II toxin-antitoxin system HipA family toxin, partial [Verrucomicrobia bacterium]|nr:type II toxin-antitoxin system HipA family toxin [Verrucomicrobiota bacterium]
MNSPNCHICLRPLDHDSEQYHKACCLRLFDSPLPPSLPYCWEALNKLAEKIVRQHVAVPGVQP